MVIRLVISTHQTLGVEGAVTKYVVFSKIMPGNQPIDKVYICVQHILYQLTVHLVPGLLHKLAIQLFTGIGNAVCLMPYRPLGAEHVGIPCGAADFLVFLQHHDLFAAVGGTGGGGKAGCASADHQHVAVSYDFLVGLRPGRGKIGVGDHIVVTDCGAVTTVDALFRINPVFCTFETDCADGTFYPAAVAARAVLPVNDICHGKTSCINQLSI